MSANLDCAAVKDMGHNTIVRSVICYFRSYSMETKGVEQAYFSILKTWDRTITCSDLLFTRLHPNPRSAFRMLALPIVDLF